MRLRVRKWRTFNYIQITHAETQRNRRRVTPFYFTLFFSASLFSLREILDTPLFRSFQFNQFVIQSHYQYCRDPLADELGVFFPAGKPK